MYLQGCWEDDQLHKIAQINPKLNSSFLSGFKELTAVGSGCVIWDELEPVESLLIPKADRCGFPGDMWLGPGSKFILQKEGTFCRCTVHAYSGSGLPSP